MADIAAIESWDIDGTPHQVGIRNIYVNEKGNLCIETSAEMSNTSKGNINIESMKNVQIKPGGAGDIRFYSDHCTDLEQVVLHAFDGTKTVPFSNDDIPVRLKINCSELELNDKDSVDRETGSKIAGTGYDVKFKSGSKWTRGKIKGASMDIRAIATAPGTGGGIAVQIASCDSDYHENKFKLETDRKVPIGNGQPTSATYEEMYNGEGGTGIEILTINSQFFSAFNGSYRFNAAAPIYAVTRGPLEYTAATGKTDYPTQSDDSKDIIDDSNPITWQDVVNAVKYLKSSGKI